MLPSSRPEIHIYHTTSHACHFFGREAELAVLNEALHSERSSLIALVGPGGQGKTAIVQEWLTRVGRLEPAPEGVFLWSFYRGKDSDQCLRELYAAVEGLLHAPEVSASYCVDHLLPLLRRRRWVVVLDGTEVVQYESGPWAGRFLHPELGRLLEELATAPQAGATLLTTRFPLAELERRPCARILALDTLDAASARHLLTSLGVQGTAAELDAVAATGGYHAKAVELLGTYLVRFHAGDARLCALPEVARLQGTSEEEHKVIRILAAYQAALPREEQDILALATAFRDPPTEARLLEYLASAPVQALLHETWQRTYTPFQERPPGWLADTLQSLVQLRLLERVGLDLAGTGSSARPPVIDAHPLVRRAFENVLGAGARRESAGARAGFLRGRPDRRKPLSLEDAREDVELFHAYCEGGLWEEADQVLTALDKPRYRFLAPAFERDLLLRFFPSGDWRRPPLWPGFQRFRNLAICLELLGSFEEALDAYPAAEAPLRGDALLALGRLEPFFTNARPPHPWQMLWQAYQTHALCLAGRVEEAVALCGRLVPSDLYEWMHVFECLLRAGRLDVLDMKSFLYRPPHAAESRWDILGRQRMRADCLRLADATPNKEIDSLYEDLVNEYDRGGLVYERALSRLSYARRQLQCGAIARAASLNETTLALARRHRMRIVEADAWRLEEDIGIRLNDMSRVSHARARSQELCQQSAYRGPARP